MPKVTLEAEKQQDLSQAELISYLLFGKRIVDLGGDQGGLADPRAAVQSALSLLSGEIEQTIVSGGVPVDYVEIRPAVSTAVGQSSPLGLQLAVGRQLGPKTFLVVNAGFCGVSPRTPGISLQFRVSPEWRTEASFEPVLLCDPVVNWPSNPTVNQVGLDLFWERRY